MGKNELNEHALRWKFCIKQNSHVRLSLQACLKPSIILTFSPESPTRSRSIRSWAIWRSSGVNQEVVRGVLGSRKKPKMATNAVTAPSLGLLVKIDAVWKQTTYMMKSHLQPAMPFTPSKPANTPAAISPENPVARICAQYSNAIRVATSVFHQHTARQPDSSNITHLSSYRRYSTYKWRQDRRGPQ